MTHRLTTNYAKNYCNRTLIVKVIVENVVTCFFWDTVTVYTFQVSTAFQSQYIDAVIKKQMDRNSVITAKQLVKDEAVQTWASNCSISIAIASNM